MKRFALQLLCLLLVLSMGIAFAACDDDAPIPTPEPDTESGTPAGDGETTYTEEDARVALTNMSTQLADQKNYSLATTLEITAKMGSETHTFNIPMVLSVDENANMCAKLTVPESLKTYLGYGQIEVYLTDTGIYLGTDGPVVDAAGNPVVSYISTDVLTTGTLAELQSLVDALFAIIGDETLPEDTPATYDAAETASPFTFSGLTAPTTSLTLTGIADGGYLLTAKADLMVALNAFLQSLTQALTFDPHAWLVENYGAVLPELLATYGEMTMEDVLDALDAQLGTETVDELLTVIAGYLLGDTEDTLNDDGTDLEPSTPADELRAMIVEMTGGMKSVELLAAYWPMDGFPTYDAEAADQSEYYGELAAYLFALVPEGQIGEFSIGDATIAELVGSVTVLSCKASVAFTLSENYLPTACTVEADASIMYHEDATDLLKTKIYGVNVKATAALSFDKAVTLPTVVIPQPLIDSTDASYDGTTWEYGFSVQGNGFVVKKVTAVLNGETIEIGEDEYGIEMDPDSGITYLTLHVQASSASTGSGSDEWPIISIELTYEAGNEATYTAILQSK